MHYQGKGGLNEGTPFFFFLFFGWTQDEGAPNAKSDIEKPLPTVGPVVRGFPLDREDLYVVVCCVKWTKTMQRCCIVCEPPNENY